MNDAPGAKSLSLSKLTIDHASRPTGSTRHTVRALLALFLVVIALGAVGAWWYYRTTGRNIIAALTQPPVDVGVMVVPPLEKESSPGQTIVLVASGKVVSDRKVDVATKVSGQIVELSVEQGDRVEAGQVLARVEDVVYVAQRDEAAANVERNRQAVTRAEAEDRRAKSTIAQLQAQYEFEQRNFERLSGLREQDRASDLEYLNAKNTYEAAKAALDAARSASASATTTVEWTKADLAASEAVLRVLQKRVDDCAIRAPIGGVVLERNAQIGDFLAAEGGRGANANAQLVSIADMSLLRVEVDISERDVGRLSAGQPARVTPDSNRKKSYNGKILWIDPQGNYAKATVQTKVRILDPGPDLRVEGSAKVEFLSAPIDAGHGAAAGSTAPAPASYWLPLSAVKVSSDGVQAFVFTVLKERAVAHPVRIGARTDKTIEVLSGVYSGMCIVAENVDAVEPDAAVHVARTINPNDL